MLVNANYSGLKKGLQYNAKERVENNIIPFTNSYNIIVSR